MALLYCRELHHLQNFMEAFDARLHFFFDPLSALPSFSILSAQ